MDFLAVKTDLGLPLIVPLFKPHAFISRYPDRTPAVELVLCKRTNPKIAPSVIEAVTVSMVYNLALRLAHNLAMHTDSAVFDASIGIKFSSRIYGVPFVLAEVFVIFGVHDSELSLGEWYESYFFVFRLDDLRAYYFLRRAEVPAGGLFFEEEELPRGIVSVGTYPDRFCFAFGLYGVYAVMTSFMAQVILPAGGASAGFPLSPHHIFQKLTNYQLTNHQSTTHGACTKKTAPP